MSSNSNDPALKDLFLSQGKRQRYIKGQVIQTTSKNKFFRFISSGYVKRYLITNDGLQAVDAIYGPCDTFSLSLVYGSLLGQSLYEGPEVYYYEAMNDCDVYLLDIVILQKQAESNPLIYKHLFIEAGKRLHVAIQGLENITIKSAYCRVAHILYYYAVNFGHRKGSYIELNIPMTHQDIANALSLTRETVSVAFVALRDKKLINGNKYIQILDIDKLADAAYN